MKLNTLELCVLQITVLESLKDLIEKYEEKMTIDQKMEYNMFMLSVVIPSKEFIVKHIGKIGAPSTAEVLFNLAVELAAEINERNEAEEKLEK